MRPGPQKRLDNAINVFWTSRNEWWIRSAEDRTRWRLHGDIFVEATAPPTRDGDYTEMPQLQENITLSSGSVGASCQEPSASEVADTGPCSVLASDQPGAAAPPSDPPTLVTLVLSQYRSSQPALAHRTSQAGTQQT